VASFAAAISETRLNQFREQVTNFRWH
jgi:hypothetical protein